MMIEINIHEYASLIIGMCYHRKVNVLAVVWYYIELSVGVLVSI